MGIFLISLSLTSVDFIVTRRYRAIVSAGPLAEELRDSANYTHVRKALVTPRKRENATRSRRFNKKIFVLAQRVTSFEISFRATQS